MTKPCQVRLQNLSWSHLVNGCTGSTCRGVTWAGHLWQRMKLHKKLVHHPHCVQWLLLEGAAKQQEQHNLAETLLLVCGSDRDENGDNSWCCRRATQNWVHRRSATRWRSPCPLWAQLSPKSPCAMRHTFIVGVVLAERVSLSPAPTDSTFIMRLLVLYCMHWWISAPILASRWFAFMPPVCIT
jgi:hypothetical protein